MKYFIIPALVLAACATSEDIAGKPAKAAFQSAKPRADLEHCIADRLSYLGAPSMVPAGPAASRVQFVFGNRIFSSVTITDGPPQRIELRGVSGDRVRNRLGACL